MFRPLEPFAPEDFPDAERPFPIAEVFGYHRELRTHAARLSFSDRRCPFAENYCEKFRQYGYGYCSVEYQAAADDRPATYAVCDHRLDGGPVRSVVADYFGPDAGEVVLVPEVVLTTPRQSFDFIALEPRSNNFVGIETQAIDLRGGGVGPIFESMLQGDPRSWRARMTQEAHEKGRSDKVAYGVNTANIYKRLGLQVAEKAELLRGWGSRLYVVVQERPFRHFADRVDIAWSDGADWDITFLTFDYSGRVDRVSGQMELVQRGVYRTTVPLFSAALVEPTATLTVDQFLRRVRKKAGLR